MYTHRRVQQADRLLRKLKEVYQRGTEGVWKTMKELNEKTMRNNTKKEERGSKG